jgi:hypothetical protein
MFLKNLERKTKVAHNFLMFKEERILGIVLKV